MSTVYQNQATKLLKKTERVLALEAMDSAFQYMLSGQILVVDLYIVKEQASIYFYLYLPSALYTLYYIIQFFDCVQSFI